MSLRYSDIVASHAPEAAAGLRIGGLTPFTTIDFPGRLAAVVYCRGCNLRCRYCHNADMQGTTPVKGDKSWQEVKNFLVSRRHALEGVVFTGGEPILQKALIGAMQEVRELGFQTALHTAGTAPERLEKILPLVDWVGFDVKTVFEDYQTVTGVQGMGEKARNGLEMLLASGADYEVRTTVDPELIPAEKLIEVAKTISAMGVKTYRLQESSRRKSDYPQQVEKQIASYFGDFDVRRDPLSSVSAA